MKAERAEHGVCGGRTLHETVTVGTCHLTFVQAHRRHSSKSGAHWKLWAVGDSGTPVGIH